MHPAIARLANRRFAVWSNVILALAALLASTVKGPLFVAGLPFALIAFSIHADYAPLQRAFLGLTGLLVGCGFLIITVGTYAEILSGNWKGESLLVGLLLTTLTLPTFLYLYSRREIIDPPSQ